MNFLDRNVIYNIFVRGQTGDIFTHSPDRARYSGTFMAFE